MDAALVAPLAAACGESPVWDAAHAALWMIDATAGRIHRLDARTGAVRAWDTGERYLGCIAPRAAGGFVAAAGQRVLAFDPEAGGLAAIAAIEPPPPGDSVANDGKAGPDGALWFGVFDWSQAPGAGALYRLAPGGQPEALLRGLTLPNGLAWLADGRFALVDSLANTITLFPAGAVSAAQGRIAVRCEAAHGLPDGMAADQEGKVWVAHWGGACVRRWDLETGAILAEVALPVSQPASVAFGGDDLRTLYVTTAWTELTDAQRAREPLAGAVFAIRVETPGLPVDRFRG